MSHRNSMLTIAAILVAATLAGIGGVVAMIQAADVWGRMYALAASFALLGGLYLFVGLFKDKSLNIFEQLHIIGSGATGVILGSMGLAWLLFGETGVITVMVIGATPGLISLFVGLYKDRHGMIAEMRREWREAKWW